MPDKTVAGQGWIAYRDLRGYLKVLEEAGLLKRIRAEVDLRHEIGAICVKSLRGKGPGLLFENINGYKGFSLVSNILSTAEQLAIVFGTEADDLKIYQTIEQRKENPIQPRVVEGGPCQEEVHLGDDVDVYEFPTPWWHELDGGQYIGTTAGVITADPDSESLNMGMYRVMIKDRNTLTLNIKGSHPIGKAPSGARGEANCAAHILKNEARGRATPVAIAIGMDPILTFIAAHNVPAGESKYAEYGAAGGIRGGPVELVRCRTNGLLVPAHAEIILEGEALTGVRHREGPHGESQGFYGWNDQAFVMKVHCVTHRESPINYGLICGCREDYPKFIKYSGFQAKLREIPGIRQVYEPDISGGRCRMMIISAKVNSPADVKRIMETIDTIPYDSRTTYKPRWSIIGDDDCDVRDWDDVLWRIIMGVMPDRDMKVGPCTDLTAHEPLAELYDSKASSVIIDATLRSKRGIAKGEEGFPPVNKVSRELMAKVEARWKEYGMT